MAKLKRNKDGNTKAQGGGRRQMLTSLLVICSICYSMYLQNELAKCNMESERMPDLSLNSNDEETPLSQVTEELDSTAPLLAQAEPMLRLSMDATPTASEYLQNITSTNNPKCQKLPNGGPISLVWAWDDPPTRKALQTTIRSILSKPQHDTLEVVIWCGSTACKESAQEAARGEDCVSVHYILAPLLAQGTPLADWVGDHVLAKLLSANHFEATFQVVIQLVVLYQLGGLIVLPGTAYTASSNLLESIKKDAPTILWKENPSSLVKRGVGGGILAVAAKPKHATIQQIMEQFLVAYRWPNYVANQWPVQIRWDTLCQGLAACQQAERHEPNLLQHTMGIEDLVALKPQRHFGTLSYQARRSYLLGAGNPGMNRGDEMQGLAGLQFLPRLDAFVERDRLDVVSVIQSNNFKANNSVSTTTPAQPATVPTTVFFNAWWGTPDWVWPPPGALEPIFVAMHLNSAKAKKDVTQHADYLQQHWPLGARDMTTHIFFKTIGAHSVFSACMTMTLISSWHYSATVEQERTNDILLVDVNAAGLQILPEFIQKHDNLKVLSAKLVDKDVVDDQVARYHQAHDMKVHLQRAKLVITQRLHVALPAASMGTPVILIMDNNLPGGGGEKGLARFSGLQAAVHTVDAAKGPSELASFDWDNPPANPHPEMIRLRRNALNVLSMCTGNGEVVDAARKFGVLPPSWEYPQEKDVCQKEDLENDDDDRIQIATAINPDWVDKEAILPSWIHALYKSNPNQKFSFYLLTNNMNPKERCVVRWMFLRWFPDAKVYTLRMDDALKNLPYLGIVHVPVVTQARLYLPQILPCVRRLLWIDMDAMVIHPLKEMWDQWAVMPPCGIVGRSSEDKQAMAYMMMKLDIVNPIRLWRRAYKGRAGFNAGVMIMDLGTLRESQFTETIASYWSFTLGGNDQISMNMQCNGTHGELDRTWNVFQDYPKDPVNKQPQDWKIVHFQGLKKPWVTKRDTQHNKIWGKYSIALVHALLGPVAATKD